MSENQSDPSEAPQSAGATIARFAKIVLLVFGLLLGGIAVTAWVVGDETDLPLEYEGFD